MPPVYRRYALGLAPATNKGMEDIMIAVGTYDISLDGILLTVEVRKVAHNAITSAVFYRDEVNLWKEVYKPTAARIIQTIREEYEVEL